jgi:hypothetical protein
MANIIKDIFKLVYFLFVIVYFPNSWEKDEKEDCLLLKYLHSVYLIIYYVNYTIQIQIFYLLLNYNLYLRLLRTIIGESNLITKMLCINFNHIFIYNSQ